MRNGKRAPAIFLCVCLLVSCFTGCYARKTEIQYVIGVSLANLSEQWRIELKRELQAEADQHQTVRLVIMDAAGESEKQAADVEKLLKFGIDLLIISPCEVEALTPVISDAYAKVPVIVMDRAVEGYDYSLFIGPDNKLIGRQAADSVLSLMQKDGAMDSTVLELSVDGFARESRSAEFTEVLTKAGIATKSLYVKEPTRDCTEDTLLAHPESLDDVHVIFAHNDFMAYGAYLALQKLGINGLRIVGMDGFSGEKGGLELVEQGIIDATVTCPTGGTEAIQYALDIMNQQMGIPKQIILRSHQIWPENLQKFKQKERISSPKDTIRVGYAQIREDSRWREASTESIEKAAKEFHIDLTFAFNDLSSEVQREQVREFIAEGMDVIVISPIVTEGWKDVLEEAKNANIPVLLVDRGVASPEIYADSFIGADFEEEGRRCASWMIRETEKWKEVRIMELRGTDGASPAEARKRGFASAIENDPRYRIVYSESADFSREGGYQAVKDYLKMHGCGIDVIFAHNDDMAIGAVKALKESGIRPGIDVKIMCIDGTSDGLKAVQKGEINFVAECNPLLGEQLMKAITDLVNGKELPLRIITDERVFTRDTPQEAFQNRKY